MARANLSKEGDNAASDCDGAGRGKVSLYTFPVNIGRGKASENFSCDSRYCVTLVVAPLMPSLAGCKLQLCTATTLMSNELFTGLEEVANDLEIERRRKVQEAGPVDAEADVLLASRFEKKPLKIF